MFFDKGRSHFCNFFVTTALTEASDVAVVDVVEFVRCAIRWLSEIYRFIQALNLTHRDVIKNNVENERRLRTQICTIICQLKHEIILE